MRNVTFWPGPGGELLQAAQRILDATGSKLQGKTPEDEPAAIRNAVNRSRGALRATATPLAPVHLAALELSVRIWSLRASTDCVLVSGETAVQTAHAAFSHAAMNANRSVRITGDEEFRTAVLDAAKDYPAIFAEPFRGDAIPEHAEVVACPPSIVDGLLRSAVARFGPLSTVPLIHRGERAAVFGPLEDGDPPVGFLRAIHLLLEHLNEHQAAARLDRALRATEDSPSIDAILSALR